MAFAITNWNINPNRQWFVRLADAGSNISVELYLTLANAQSRDNKQASGDAVFGSDKPVALTNAPGATHPVELFQSSYSWHLRITGLDGDPTKIFKVKEFVDLDEISDPIYRNEALIPLRATAEINAHTHAKIPRAVGLGSHIPTLEVGQVARINSARLDANVLGQVMEHRISGNPNQLASSLEVASYLALKR
jgi:hypothetical protein